MFASLTALYPTAKADGFYGVFYNDQAQEQGWSAVEFLSGAAHG